MSRIDYITRGVLVDDHKNRLSGLIIFGKDKVEQEFPSINKDTTDYDFAESALKNLRNAEKDFKLY
jgi:hypothetical protein